MRVNINKNNSGFTIIELLLYIILVSVLLLVVSTFLGTILKSRIKNQTIAEVTQQGQYTMNIITQTIRNSESINSPTMTNNATLLDLDVINTTNDPTVFDLLGGALRITEGIQSPINLTSTSTVVVSNLRFDNLSRTGTPGNIKIEFTISHINPSGRYEYDYSKTFYSSASLR